MGHKPALSSEERLEILELLKRGNLSHREIASRFNRAQSTTSKIARDACITPTHRRRRTPAAKDVESTFSASERIHLADKVLGVLGEMVESGGLSPRELREVTQSLKLTLEARRAEDQLFEPDADRKDEEKEMWSLGMGDLAVDLRTPFGRFMKQEFEEIHRQSAEEEQR